jgi:hypothetical protein
MYCKSRVHISVLRVGFVITTNRLTRLSQRTVRKTGLMLLLHDDYTYVVLWSITNVECVNTSVLCVLLNTVYNVKLV